MINFSARCDNAGELIEYHTKRRICEPGSQIRHKKLRKPSTDERPPDLRLYSLTMLAASCPLSEN
jgi:hypothetical protein